MADPILSGLQTAIDADQPGWQIVGYVVAVGIERIDEDGRIESGVGFYSADGQPYYASEGLLLAAQRLNDRETTG